MIGTSLTFNIGISVPDDLSNWKCYQAFAGLQGSLTFGLGAYAGFGVGAIAGKTNGPMQSSTGIYRYGEANAGWGPSGSVSATGKENVLEGGGGMFGPARRLLDPEGWRSDSVANIGVPFNPKIGMGFGAYAGAGYVVSGQAATPTLGGDCECS